MLRVGALLAIAVVLAACGSEEADEEWTTPPARSGDGSVSFAEFNRYIERSNGVWRRRALETAMRFLLLDAQGASEKTIVIRRARVGPPLGVVATLDRLLDDSVRSVQYTLELMQEQDGTWRIYKARWSQRCWPRRGHQEFSTELCL